MSDLIKAFMGPKEAFLQGYDQAKAKAADTITSLTAEVEWHKKNSDKWQDTQAAHLREVTRLTAEVERLNSELTDALTDLATARQDNASFMPILNRLTAENEKLKAGLRECEAELNAYYRMKYPGGHPHSQKELAQAMASNPATVALKENNSEHS